jgi:transcriptional regulator with XRE-family HTH domain
MAKIEEKGISRRLRQVLEVREMSQADLAKRANTSTGAVSQWLSGAKQPSRENIRTLAAVLQVDPQWLEYGSGLGPQPDEAKERAEYERNTGWRMRQAPVDGGRDYGNPIVETFPPDLPTMVREATQNVLDQVTETMARIVFRVVRLRGNELKKFLKAMAWEELRTHLDPASTVQQRHGRLLKAALDDFDRAEEMLLLIVEDSGTTGLIGEEYGEGNFTALTRNNLDSAKSTATAGGAFGLGKGTWWRDSRFFVVLFNSDLSSPTENGKQDTRIIGRAELPWHNHPDQENACAGPGWFGCARTKNSVQVAESYWNNGTLAHDLYMERAVDAGPGTTICVVGFYDPSSDEAKDPRDFAEDIETAVADYFWPAIVDGKLTVSVETWEGRSLKTQAQVDVSSRETPLVEAMTKLRAQNLVARLSRPGDVVRREVILPIPARIAPDSPHASFEHRAVLLVRRAAEDDDNKWLNHLATLRSPRMVVEYLNLKNVFAGAVPFHAVLLCGEAAAVKPDAPDTKADRFLRTAEPPSHNKWSMTPDLKTDYARGSKKAIDNMFYTARREIGELIRVPSTGLDDGPNALKELLKIGDDVAPPPERPRIYRPSASLDADGRWVVDARIRVLPNTDTGWKVRPVVVFDMETGGGYPVDWAELEPLSDCALDDGRLIIAAGVNEARFRGVTDAGSHPIAATESAIRIELRQIEERREQIDERTNLSV